MPASCRGLGRASKIHRERVGFLPFPTGGSSAANGHEFAQILLRISQRPPCIPNTRSESLRFVEAVKASGGYGWRASPTPGETLARLADEPPLHPRRVRRARPRPEMKRGGPPAPASPLAHTRSSASGRWTDRERSGARMFPVCSQVAREATGSGGDRRESTRGTRPPQAAEAASRAPSKSLLF
jgi:hypothetical protein